MAAACKHFVANELERWGNHSRHEFNAQITPQDLWNYYLQPFHECSQHALGIMCSYNSVNGMPSCVNEWLLKDVLRDRWNFHGYVVTDCGALDDVVRQHHSAVSNVQAAAMAMNATVDVSCDGNGHYYPDGLLQAYQEGWVQETSVRQAFARLAMIQFQLGLFDDKGEDTRNDDDSDIIDSKQHQELAFQAALQSIVVLQNRDRLLPLASQDLALAVIGPHIHARQALLSNYHGERCGTCKNDAIQAYQCIESPLEAIINANANGVTVGIEGCHINDDWADDMDKAVAQAKVSDVAILIMGLDQTQEQEELDRLETTLPGRQQELIHRVLDVQPKTVLVLLNGGTMSLGREILDRTAAIVEASYGGQSGSRAMASILFGRYNPTGKLAATMYPPSYVHDIPMTEMGLTVGVGRTYMYYTGDPEFSFGHGLSYSNWTLSSDALVSYETILDGASQAAVHWNVTVTNHGPYPGGQTILLFGIPLDAQVNFREKLLHFQGTKALNVGESQLVTFTISVNDIAVWDDSIQDYATIPGRYQIDARTSNNVRISRTLRVKDTTVLPREVIKL